MKQAGTLIATFLLNIAQFIIGVMILAGKADIRTIGAYYIVASCFSVFVVMIGIAAIAYRNDSKEK